MGDGVLIRSVIIHGPDFFVTAAVAHKVNRAFRDTLDASTQSEDDLIGKLVGNQTRRIRGRRICVLLTEYLGRGDVLHVIEPALYHYGIVADSKVAEGQHGSVRRRRAPHLELDLGGLTWHLQRVKALGDQIEDAGIIEIVPQSVVKRFKKVSVFRILIGGLEVGNSQTNLFHA